MKPKIYVSKEREWTQKERKEESRGYGHVPHCLLLSLLLCPLSLLTYINFRLHRTKGILICYNTAGEKMAEGRKLMRLGR